MRPSISFSNNSKKTLNKTSCYFFFIVLHSSVPDLKSVIALSSRGLGGGTNHPLPPPLYALLKLNGNLLKTIDVRLPPKVWVRAGRSIVGLMIAFISDSFISQNRISNCMKQLKITKQQNLTKISFIICAKQLWHINAKLNRNFMQF